MGSAFSLLIEYKDDRRRAASDFSLVRIFRGDFHIAVALVHFQGRARLNDAAFFTLNRIQG